MVAGFQEERQRLDVPQGQQGARQHQVVQCNVIRSATTDTFYLLMNAGGGRASALTGGSTTPTGMQSSIKNFFGKEVSKLFVIGQPLFCMLRPSTCYVSGPTETGEGFAEEPWRKIALPTFAYDHKPCSSHYWHF